MTKTKAFNALLYCKRHAVIKENIELQITAGDEYKSHP